MNKITIISLSILLAFSVTFNVFFLTKDAETLPEKDEQKAYIVSLEAEINALSTLLENEGIQQNIPNKPIIENKLSLEQSSINFLQHMYLVSSTNYSQLKNNAREIMSEELFEVLFAAHGIDEKNTRFTSQLGKVEVFENSQNLKAFIHYEVISKDNLTDIKTLDIYSMILYFKEVNGKYIVEAIEPISDMGAV